MALMVSIFFAGTLGPSFWILGNMKYYNKTYVNGKWRTEDKATGDRLVHVDGHWILESEYNEEEE